MINGALLRTRTARWLVLYPLQLRCITEDKLTVQRFLYIATFPYLRDIPQWYQGRDGFPSISCKLVNIGDGCCLLVMDSESQSKFLWQTTDPIIQDY